MAAGTVRTRTSSFPRIFVSLHRRSNRAQPQTDVEVGERFSDDHPAAGRSRPRQSFRLLANKVCEYATKGVAFASKPNVPRAWVPLVHMLVFLVLVLLLPWGIVYAATMNKFTRNGPIAVVCGLREATIDMTPNITDYDYFRYIYIPDPSPPSPSPPPKPPIEPPLEPPFEPSEPPSEPPEPPSEPPSLEPPSSEPPSESSPNLPPHFNIPMNNLSTGRYVRRPSRPPRPPPPPPQPPSPFPPPRAVKQQLCEQSFEDAFDYSLSYRDNLPKYPS
ncbi:hypothetical protein Vretimale_19594, partial [Volvox reticuliferus]